MDFTKLSNPTVRSAIQALDVGDVTTWRSLFANTVAMTDNGSARDFEQFTANALGKEKFVSIDMVDNDCRDVYGQFNAGWGQFRAFFKFTIGADGRISALDIGQA